MGGAPYLGLKLGGGGVWADIRAISDVNSA